MVKHIPLTRNKNSEVDDCDYDWIIENNWYAQKRSTKYEEFFVAARTQHLGMMDGKQLKKSIYMHRAIVEKMLEEEGNFDLLEKFINNPNEYQVDHINGKTLKNIRSNLKIVNNRQNSQNKHIKKTSKYPGVSWNKQRGMWEAKIRYKDKRHYIDYFHDDKEGYKVYKYLSDLIESGKEKEFYIELKKRRKR